MAIHTNSCNTFELSGQGVKLQEMRKELQSLKPLAISAIETNHIWSVCEEIATCSARVSFNIFSTC